MFFSRRRRMGEYPEDQVAQDQMPSTQGPVVYSGWSEQQQREIMKERQKQIKKQAQKRAEYIKELEKRQRKAQEEAQKRAEREWKAMKKIMDQESRSNPNPLFRDRPAPIPAPSFSPSIHAAPERSKEIDHPFVPAPNPPESILPAPIIPPPQQPSTTPSTNWNNQQRPSTAWWEQPVGVYTEEYQMEFKPAEVVEGVKNLPAAAAEVARQAMSFDLLAPLARGAQAVAETLPTVEYTGFSDQEYPERSHYFESMPASKGIGFGAGKAVADIHQMRTDVITSGVDYYRGLTDDQLKTAMQQGDTGASFEYNKRFPAYAVTAPSAFDDPFAVADVNREQRKNREQAYRAMPEFMLAEAAKVDDLAVLEQGRRMIAQSRVPETPTNWIPIPEPIKLETLQTPDGYIPTQTRAKPAGIPGITRPMTEVESASYQSALDSAGRGLSVASGSEIPQSPPDLDKVKREIKREAISYALGQGYDEISRAWAEIRSSDHGDARWESDSEDLPQNYLKDTADGARRINSIVKEFISQFASNRLGGSFSGTAENLVKRIAPEKLIKRAEFLASLNPSKNPSKEQIDRLKKAGYPSYDSYVKDVARADRDIRDAYENIIGRVKDGDVAWFVDRIARPSMDLFAAAGEPGGRE